MTKIINEIWIDASRQKVWDQALKDFGDIYLWNPGVSKSHTTNSKPTGLGAERHCDLNLAGALRSRNAS